MGPIKAAGKYRQEGKTYVRILARHAVEERKRRTADMVKQVVQDGDIVHFQFSQYNLGVVATAFSTNCLVIDVAPKKQMLMHVVEI